jgi:hypothetical protein
MCHLPSTLINHTMGESPSLVAATGTAYVSSFVLTVVALGSPAWIITDFHGNAGRREG